MVLPTFSGTDSIQREDVLCLLLGASTRASFRNRCVSNTAPVRLTDFWERMRTQFGPTYAESFARDFVLSELGGRTIREALDQGEEIVTVWRAVCKTVDVDPTLR
jgi:hypothetical protein